MVLKSKDINTFIYIIQNHIKDFPKVCFIKSLTMVYNMHINKTSYKEFAKHLRKIFASYNLEVIGCLDINNINVLIVILIYIIFNINHSKLKCVI